MPGYTYLTTSGTAALDDTKTTYASGSVTVTISNISEDETITVHYGADGGGAEVPTEVDDYSFVIQTKGTDTNARFRTVSTLAVPVYSQAKGGGNAKLTLTDSDSDTRASDTVDTIEIVYTAAGEIQGGKVKLTAPADWPELTADNLDSSTGTPVLDALTATLSGVNLDAEGTITFTYTGATAQPTKGTATFKVEVDGGAGPGVADDNFGTAVVAEGQVLEIEVDYARSGSGDADVHEDSLVVTAGSEGNDLVFIYTAAGEIGHSARDFRVVVDGDWPPANKEAAADDEQGTYSVTLLRDGDEYTDIVKKVDPIDGRMVARIEFGAESVLKDDQIIFTYENATAPRTPEVSVFKVFFGNGQVGDDLNVIVQSEMGASELVVEASDDKFSVDAEESVMVTVKFQDDDGNIAAMATPTDVDLDSTSNTGTFSLTEGGAAVSEVEVPAGSDSAMVYYTDTEIGEATITASVGNLEGEATVTGGTDVVEITSATVTSLAKAGETVTVSAMGTAGKSATFVTVGGHVDKSMVEAPASTYSGSFTVVKDSHPDGTYDVTVNLNGESMTLTAALTLDSTAPTVTASASPDTVANGDPVTISAVVTGDATSVTANVSLLDIGAASVALTDADADGTYTGMHTISADNVAANGEQLITVTAMDAAGNSSDATATVTLENATVLHLDTTAGY